jgi:hypothetical protein
MDKTSGCSSIGITGAPDGGSTTITESPSINGGSVTGAPDGSDVEAILPSNIGR